MLNRRSRLARRRQLDQIRSQKTSSRSARATSVTKLQAQLSIVDDTDAISLEAGDTLTPLTLASTNRGEPTTHPYSTLNKCDRISRHKKCAKTHKAICHHKLQPVNSKTNTSDIIRSNRNDFPTLNSYKMMYHICHPSAILFALCALLIPTQTTFAADSNLVPMLKKLQITPDIIRIPDRISTIRIELHNNQVRPGDSVPAKNFKELNMGKITWDVSNFDARHTLLLLDLDRKSSTNHTLPSIYNQFTSLNIPGNIINAGQTIVAFDTPVVPCQQSTKHRILMLAFHQEQNIDISDVAYMSASSGQSSKRENFKLDEFINKHRLDLVAANVIQAYGEPTGICSGSITVHMLPNGLIIFLALAMALTYNLISRRSMHS